MMSLLFDNGAAWFSVPALFGTGIFVVRLLLMLVGGDGHLGLDTDFADGGAHGSLSGHASDAGDHGSTHAFEVLSFQSICAFMMGFGWAALAAYKGSGLSVPVSVLIGCAAGVAMVWALALMLKGMHDLQSSGNVPLQATMGAEGDVYVGVPAAGAGRGQVRLVIGSRERIVNAVSEAGELPTRTRVRVTRVNEDNTVTVAAT
ncbi:MAG: hypothetical protein KF745_08250 [Phycisphaeraceae bacterium]|nr:hypothetical protein [Phycisphaeraceae bacterium]